MRYSGAEWQPKCWQSALAQFHRLQIMLQPALKTQRERPGLLGNDQRDRVRLLRDAHARPMPQADGTVLNITLAHRKNTACG